MSDLVIPSIGDIWLDANGNHNLVLAVRGEIEETFTTFCLEQGKYWHDEPLDDWNDPAQCTKHDGLPFYRLLVA